MLHRQGVIGSGGEGGRNCGCQTGRPGRREVLPGPEGCPLCPRSSPRLVLSESDYQKHLVRGIVLFLSLCGGISKEIFTVCNVVVNVKYRIIST